MSISPTLFSLSRHCVGRGLACAFALVALMLFSTSLHAVTLTVNNLGDAPDAIPSDGICATSGNVCTLRAAIQTANSLGGANVITVPSGTIVLGSVLGLLSDITINGAGTGSTVISGNGVTQVFVFSLNGINVAMNDLTIANGNSTAGAGIFVSLSTLSLSRVLVTNNAATTGGIQQGGGIRLSGTLNMIDSTVSNNSAGFGGGGLRILTGAIANIVNSTFSGNTMTGANGSGAAIENQGTLNLLNSTISGNNSLLGPSGGLSLAGGAATIRFSTITGNASNYAPAQVQFFGAVGDTLAISGSIIGNPASGVSCSGPFVGTSLGNNLDSGNTCGFTAAGDLSNTNPLLSPLANNGGPTQTHALQAGSPAINAGPTTGTIPATDQRGAGFARVLNGQADIGAFESASVSATPLPVVSVGNASVVEGNSGTQVLNFPVTLSGAAPVGGVTITYSTANGTATAGSDYVAVVAGTVTIAQGASSGSLPVTINGDATVEPNETFTVTISNATNATLGTATATGTILNDDVVVAAPVTPVPVNSLWLLLATMLGVIALQRKLSQPKATGRH